MVRRKSPPGPTFVLSRASFGCGFHAASYVSSFAKLLDFHDDNQKAKNEVGGGIFLCLRTWEDIKTRWWR